MCDCTHVGLNIATQLKIHARNYFTNLQVTIENKSFMCAWLAKCYLSFRIRVKLQQPIRNSSLNPSDPGITINKLKLAQEREIYMVRRCSILAPHVLPVSWAVHW